jgi:hypothetical protein
MTRADDDWTGTHVGFRLQLRDGATWLQFSHAGWKSPNEHYRVSSNCWAMTCGSCGDTSNMVKPSRTMCDWTRKMADALQIFTRLKPGHHSLPARAACATAAVAMARRAEHDDAERPGVLAVIGRLLASPLRAACV